MKPLAFLFQKQVQRAFCLQARQLRTLVNACLFFLMILVFFPLTMPPDPVLLRTIAPGVVWISLLFALFLSSEQLFQADYDDGVIEQWLVSGRSIRVIVSAHILVHGVLNTLPMIIFCPIFALLYGLTGHDTLILIISLLCGAPAILYLCALAAAFSTGLQQKGVFMALIVLPLTIPVILFGSATLTAAMQGLPVHGYLALLCALSLVAITLLPYAIAAVIRVGMVD